MSYCFHLVTTQDERSQEKREEKEDRAYIFISYFVSATACVVVVALAHLAERERKL